MPTLTKPVRAALLTLLLLLFLASLVLVVVESPEGIRLSADPGSPLVPLWAVLLPQVVGIALTLLLPPSRNPQPVRMGKPRNFRASTIILVAIAVLFPLLGSLLPLLPEDLILLKFAMLILVPAVTVAFCRKAVHIARRTGAWRWWAPAVVIAVWMILSEFMPWAEPFDAAAYDLQALIIGAVATAITASIGEELFYRRWLQTRLEAVAGPWLGLAMVSLLFALMHFTTHAGGDNLALETAQMIVFQGSFGLLVGLMWMRYRNLLAIILIHLIANGWGIAAALLWPSA